MPYGWETRISRHGRQIYHVSTLHGRVERHGLKMPQERLVLPSGTKVYDGTGWTLNVAYTACTGDLSGVSPTRVPGFWVDRGGQMRELMKSYISPLHTRQNFGTNQVFETLSLLAFILLLGQFH